MKLLFEVNVQMFKMLKVSSKQKVSHNMLIRFIIYFLMNTFKIYYKYNINA